MSDAEPEEITLDTSSNDGDLSAVSHDAHEFEKRLIEEVKQRPFLFDHTNGGFKDLKKKDAAWAQVAEAVGNSVNKCQCRWKSLRDRYVRESRKMREGNGPKRHLWEMFKYLTFLDDIPRLHRGGGPGYVENTIWATKSGRVSGKRPAIFVIPTSSPQQSPPAVQLTVSSAASTSHNSQTLVAAPAAITPTSSTSAPALTVQLAENPTLPATNRKSNSGTVTNSNGTNVITNNNSNNHILTTFVDMADGCSAFGMSVSATLRTLPSAQQELAKLRIQQVLYEVQFS